MLLLKKKMAHGPYGGGTRRERRESLPPLPPCARRDSLRLPALPASLYPCDAGSPHDDVAQKSSMSCVLCPSGQLPASLQGRRELL